MYYVGNADMSFRNKISYIRHAQEYKTIRSKLQVIKRLISSSGKYDLCITQERCEYVTQNHKKSIFSRFMKIYLKEPDWGILNQKP